MATAYTSLLGLALPVTGELSGSWGDVVNDSITSLLDSAISGTTSLTTDADVTLTTTTGLANEARQAIILWNPASGTVTRNITAPAQSKIYTVINASGGTQSIVLRGAGPTTGVTIVKGESAQVAWNGTDFVKIGNIGGEGSFTALSVSGAVTLSGGIANGVTYLNGSKVLTTGSALTFDGTNLGVTGGSNFIGSGTGPKLSIRNAATGQTGFTSVDNGSFYFDAFDHVWRNASASSEFMRLTSTGLGIGTSSPGQKLHVVSATTQALFEGSAQGNIIIQKVGTAGISINSDAAGKLSFYDNNSAATRLILDSSGNLGLGVTPSAWSGMRAMDIGDGSFAISADGAGAGDGSLTWNGYYNGSNWIYKYTGGGVSRFRLNESGAAWFTAPSGTAGNAISFTQAMTLQASGGLSLGTTNDAGAGNINLANGKFIGWGGLDTLIYGDSASNFLYFRTNTVERARIDSSGNLLVGTTSNPYTAKLVSVGVGDNVSADFYRPSTGTSSAIVTFCSDVGSTRALKSYIDTAGSLVSTSDARLKENVQAFDAGLNCVLELNPVYFNWKGDASTQAGFIAQEVEQVLPIAVREMQSNELNDMRTLDKNVLFPVLVKAIQEQQAIIESLKARLDALEAA